MDYDESSQTRVLMSITTYKVLIHHQPFRLFYSQHNTLPHDQQT